MNALDTLITNNPDLSGLERAAYCAQTVDAFRAYASALEEELNDMGEHRAEAESLAEQLATAEDRINTMEADNAEQVAELEATISRLEDALQDAATIAAPDAIPTSGEDRTESTPAICSAGLPTVATHVTWGEIIELRTVDNRPVRVARTHFDDPNKSILPTYTKHGDRKGGRGIHRGNLLTDGAELTPAAQLETALRAHGWRVARYPCSSEQRAKLTGMGFESIIQTAPGQFEPHPLGLAWAMPGAVVASGEKIAPATPVPKRRTAWAEFNGASLGGFPRVELLINDHAARVSHYAARIYARGETCNTAAFKPAGWQEAELAAVRADIALSSGRTIRHTPSAWAGCENAAPTTGAEEMTEAEWAEYCSIIATGKQTGAPAPGEATPSGEAADLSFRTGDMFTAFFPNTKAGEKAWREMANKTDGTGKVLNAHAADTIRQLRAAGYTVQASGEDQAEPGEVTPSGEQIAAPCPTLIPGRWIPNGAENAERIAFDAALGSEVWLIDSSARPGALAVIAYTGKRTRHDAHYTMRDRAQALQWAGEYMGKQQARAQRQAERRAEKAAKRAAGHKLKVGDVLRSSWGYDQTNIDYYEVTRLIGTRMVEIREIAAESVGDGYMTGDCVPRPGHYIGAPIRKAVSDHDGQSVKIASYAHASKIEPREVGGVKVYPVDHWTAYA